MIDITTLNEIIQPLSSLEPIATNSVSKSSKLLWVTIIIIILILCVWGYIAYRENQKTTQENCF